MHTRVVYLHFQISHLQCLKLEWSINLDHREATWKEPKLIKVKVQTRNESGRSLEKSIYIKKTHSHTNYRILRYPRHNLLSRQFRSFATLTYGKTRSESITYFPKISQDFLKFRSSYEKHGCTREATRQEWRKAVNQLGNDVAGKIWYR